MKLSANWKTTASMIGGTLMAALTWLSTLSYDQGQLALLIPVEWKPWVSKIAAIATLILFAYNGIRQKDKAVTGGTIQQTVNGNVAAPQTQSLVDETVKATVASGEDISVEQSVALRATP
jgi:hypothetical protein